MNLERQKELVKMVKVAFDEARPAMQYQDLVKYHVSSDECLDTCQLISSILQRWLELPTIILVDDHPEVTTEVTPPNKGGP